MLNALGLMSGTSMDGIDVALISSDGLTKVDRGPFLSIGYSPGFRRRLAAALEAATEIKSRDDRPGDLAEVERELTDKHVNAVAVFAEHHGIDLASVDLIGFHGQTVLHRPKQSLTVQLGDGALLAEKTGRPVVYDMRAADMEAGGEGAPLAPAYHAALAQSLDREGSFAFVNIGGISNITYVAADGTIHAFDSGPGNTLIDQWVEAKAGIPYDQGGAIASEGRVVRTMVDDFLSAPFFADTMHRSLDRNDFVLPKTDSATLEDGARSLARLTAEAIDLSSNTLPSFPQNWIICGGGRNNQAIMADLDELVTARGGHLMSAEEIGLDGDAVEAEAWAYLAIRCRKTLPISWPETTGCSKPTCGGVVVDPQQ